jgi:hypothetical protein
MLWALARHAPHVTEIHTRVAAIQEDARMQMLVLDVAHRQMALGRPVRPP